MNSLATTMLKKGNYKINVYAHIDASFFVIDSNEGYWTAFNSLGTSVIRAKTKNDVADVLRNATPEDLDQYHNAEFA